MTLHKAGAPSLRSQDRGAAKPSHSLQPRRAEKGVPQFLRPGVLTYSLENRGANMQCPVGAPHSTPHPPVLEDHTALFWGSGTPWASLASEDTHGHQGASTKLSPPGTWLGHPRGGQADNASETRPAWGMWRGRRQSEHLRPLGPRRLFSLAMVQNVNFIPNMLDVNAGSSVITCVPSGGGCW